MVLDTMAMDTMIQDTLRETPATVLADLTGDPAVISRAEAVRTAVGAASGEIESTRRLPPALLDKLHEAGLFRLLLPRSSNGIETDPVTFFHVIETIAQADASTAWCLSQAGGCAMSAAYLDLPVAHAIFGDDPRAVLAWGPGPKVKAVECEGGYKVTGVWAFASGGRHATWLGAHCPIFAADGSPKLDANGLQQERTMLVRTEDVQWTDIWNTVGLRGTASDQFALDNFFVRSDYSITREFDQECRESGPLYRMGSGTCYQVGFAGVACGIARGALDHFVDVARNKVPRGQKSTLRDNAVVQSGLAQAEVNLRAARGFVLQSMADVWKSLKAGSLITVEQRIVIRMAATHAIHKAREAVDFAYHAAGATAIFENHPLERRFRDIHTVTQQLQGRLSHFETVGAWMLGVGADLTFV
jgi:alkylation response protein AidB-like acyl-CoA dehydrogenase